MPVKIAKSLFCKYGCKFTFRFIECWNKFLSTHLSPRPLLISHNGSSSCIFHVMYRKHSNGCHQGAMTISYPFKPQYPHTTSPNWSLCISIKNKLREFDKRSMHFPFSDHFTNSHDLFSWLRIVIVGRKLMFVPLGA